MGGGPTSKGDISQVTRTESAPSAEDAALAEFSEHASTSSSTSSRNPSNTSFITSHDMAEIEQHTSQANRTALTDFNESPTPKEFSKQTFDRNTQSRRIAAGHDGKQMTPINPNDRYIGTWEAYESSTVIEKQPLNTNQEVTGRGARVMEVHKLEPSDARAADTAYVTQLDHDWAHPNAPNIHSAHSALTVTAALDTMGVAAPRHELDTDNRQVIVESIPRDGYDAEIATTETLSSEYANRVDSTQLQNVMAANVVAGNVDIKGDNIMIGEDGRAVVFDFDWNEKMHDPNKFTDQFTDWSQDAINQIEEVRDEPLDVSPDDIVQRAREIATQLHETGLYKDLHNSVEQVDKVFESLPNDEYSGFNADSVSSHADRIRVHTLGWSQKTVSKEDVEAIDESMAAKLF